MKMKKMTLMLLGAILLVACSPKVEENVEATANDTTTVVSDTAATTEVDTTVSDTTTTSM
jgi:PBP1b-binding outer membrane lipoprotein LpoB